MENTLTEEQRNAKIAELADARRRRSLVRAYIRGNPMEYYEKQRWNQSINVIRKTIKRLKRELGQA